MADAADRGLILDRFWASLSSSPRSVLMLDYDGTLAPFCTERNRAFPYPGVEDALDGLIGSGSTRVVIVSGRWTRDLGPLLRLKRLPELWGSHGLERRMPDGRIILHNVGEMARKALSEADAWTLASGYSMHSERKPGCLALHWRGLSDVATERMRKDAFETLKPLADSAGMVLANFDGGIELRLKGRDKGDAVRTVLSEEEGHRPAAYLGDDLTDEDAFEAIRGRGLSVLVRPEARPSAADLWIRPPEELLDFLRRWTGAMEGKGI